MIAKNKKIYLMSLIFALWHLQMFIGTKRVLASNMLIHTGAVLIVIVSCIVLFDIFILPLLLNSKKFSIKAGITMSFAHISLFAWAMWIATTSTSGQAGMVFIYFFISDFFLLPLFFLLPINFLISTTLIFGIMGTICWFFIPIGIAKIYNKIQLRKKKRVQEIQTTQIAEDVKKKKPWGIFFTVLACLFIILLTFGLFTEIKRKPTVLTVEGQESTHLLNKVDGCVISELARGGIKAISLPDLNEIIIRRPATDDDQYYNTVHSLSGPDKEGRIVFIDNDWNNDKHFLKVTSMREKNYDVIFSREGDALWDDVIGENLALAPSGGHVAFVGKLKPKQMPGAYLQIGPLEIWNINEKTPIKLDIIALDDGISWFSDGHRLAYTKLVPKKEIPPHKLDLKGFGRHFINWSHVPAVYIYDMSSGSDSFLHIGMDPIVSRDDTFVILRNLNSSNYKLVNIITGESKSITWPGRLGNPITFVDKKIILYKGLPTAGTPLKPGKKTVTLKLANLDTNDFQTVRIVEESELSFSFGKISDELY